jgi:hypothetical protein
MHAGPPTHPSWPRGYRHRDAATGAYRHRDAGRGMSTHGWQLERLARTFSAWKRGEWEAAGWIVNLCVGEQGVLLAPRTPTFLRLRTARLCSSLFSKTCHISLSLKHKIGTLDARRDVSSSCCRWLRGLPRLVEQAVGRCLG